MYNRKIILIFITLLSLNLFDLLEISKLKNKNVSLQITPHQAIPSKNKSYF